jgi:ATP-dependent Lhr-like helicase
LVSEANFEPLLRKRLEGSGYFGARFRECAGRALLLTRRKLGERLPLWMSRLRSQRLLQAVMKMSDFPILLETWRTCLRDEFDLEALRDKISQVASAEIRVSECRTSRPSPMARSLIWGQVNQYMYAGDELPADRASRLRGDLLRELVFTPGLRPAVSPETVRVFEEKRQRLSPGYAPAPDRELVDWIKERVLIPWPEWLRLIEAVRRDREAEESSEGEMLLPLTIPDEVLSKIARLSVSKTAALFVAARERLPEILAGIYPGAEVIIDALAEDGIAGRGTVVFPRASEEAGDELFTSLLEEWLQFYGPHLTDDIAGVLRADPDRLDLALEDLKDSESLITGPLIKDHPGVFLCDAKNFETLLRLERASAVPRVEAKEIMDLPLFLAHIQGLTQTQGGEERLFSALEPLVGYSLPAPLWESDIFPARVPDYSVSELDGVLQQGNLRWQGDEDQQVRFFFEDDLELLLPENSAEPEEEGATNDAEPTAGRLETAGAGVPQADAIPAGLFADPAARYDFGALLKRHRGDVAALEEKLWEQVWRGRVTNDTFSALRRGLQTGFRVAEAIERQKRSLEYAPRRKGLHLSRWREAQAYPGSWFLLPDARAASAADLIEQEERRKDRVRLLLDRYGLLFRELLSRERPPFRWPDVFRTLRLMELSGEILAGYFFAGIPGPQFMSQRGFRLFLQEMPQDIVYWMSAVDPASVCGVAVDALRGSFPKRVEGTHLVFCGRGLVMISQRKGRALMFLTPPNDPRLPDYLTVLRHFLTRQFNPVRRVIIETINDEPAPQSPYLAVLKQSFDVVVDINQVSLYRRVET